MAHNRKFVPGAVVLADGAVESDILMMGRVQDELEALMISSGYLKGAPFTWVGMLLRYGIKNALVPTYRRIDKKDGELELGVELDMRVLMKADGEDPELLKEYFEIAALDSLIHAGKKYKLNTAGLEKRRDELGEIPSWEQVNPLYDES